MNIAQTIDHTLLKPEAEECQVRTLCSEARQYGFAAVCVNPTWVPLVSELMRDSGVSVCSVIGFPLGATSTETKVHEAEWAIAAGAHELDMVINLGWLKGNEISKVAAEIAAVRAAAAHPVLLKVIIESALLSDQEIEAVSRLCVDEGADFVKTSTGMHAAGGAKVEHVRVMRKAVGTRAGIKASGGLRTYADAMAFLEAGASRLGCSSSVQIIEEAQARGGADQASR